MHLARSEEEITDDEDGLLLVKARLVAENIAASARLKEIIDKTVGRNPLTEGGGSVLIDCRSGRPLQVVVNPTKAGIDQVLVQVVATVYIHDPVTVSTSNMAAFRSLYSMTKRN